MSTDPFEVVDRKLQEASDCLDKAGKALIHPSHRPDFERHNAALLSCPGTIIHHPWQPNFTSELHAFLGATRSVPDVILNRFGYDSPNKNSWLLKLDRGEQQRRRCFGRRFEKRYKQFRQLPLNEARNEIHHGSGMARWVVVVDGMYGTYEGGPNKPLDAAELPHIQAGDDPALQWAAADSFPLPIIPSWQDFWWEIPHANGTVQRLPLFSECRSFLGAASGLADYARQLFGTIHANQTFTLPPW
jgi:hypothetical protein